MDPSLFANGIRALRRLHPSTTRTSTLASTGRYMQHRRSPTDALFLNHLVGKSMVGAVASDDDGKTTVVGIDIDDHGVEGQNPSVTGRKLILTCQAWDIPVLVHASKSGKGLHIRTLFSEPVPVFQARALYLCLCDVAGIRNDKAFDKVWPPSSGYGILALPLQFRWIAETGGSLALDPNTLQPYSATESIELALDAPAMTPLELAEALHSVGLDSEDKMMALSGAGRANARPVKEGTDGGLSMMLDHCLAWARFENEPLEVNYAFWFAMISNARPFIGGKETMEAYRQHLRRYNPSSRKYHPRDFEQTWRAVHGGPRLCTNLDWKCPNLGKCGCRAPAGLPMWMHKHGKTRIE